jgi:hypothetical protein
MNRIKFIVAMLVLGFLTGSAIAEEDPLSLDDAAAKEDIRTTMDEDIFTPNQDALGSATPVIMGKNVAEASVDSKSPEPKERLLSPTNSWSLKLIDSMQRAVELEMSQSENVIWGKGTIAVGDVVQAATATGTLNGNKLDLDILDDDLTLFRLYLTMNKKSMSGDYHGYSTIYMPWKGIAMGKIN